MDGDGYVAAWRARLRPGAREVYHTILADFVRYTGRAVVALVQEARQDGGYAIARIVQTYVGTLPGSQRPMVYAALRSFFAHSRAELPRHCPFVMELNGGERNDQ